MFLGLMHHHFFINSNDKTFKNLYLILNKTIFGHKFLTKIDVFENICKLLFICRITMRAQENAVPPQNSDWRTK